jgi:hypothetical protein
MLGQGRSIGRQRENHACQQWQTAKSEAQIFHEIDKGMVG